MTNAYKVNRTTDGASNIGSPSITGSDSEGKNYSSPEEMWASQGVFAGSKGHDDWYRRGALYYEEHCEATVNGVLGGFSHISDIDLEFSKSFLLAVLLDDDENTRPTTPNGPTIVGVACECGAGIGRVTKGLLLPLGASQCDLVEQCEKLLLEAPTYIGDDHSSKLRFYCQGLQEWMPNENTYSVIWIQWVLCYLVDTDIVAFLKRCGKALTKHGVIVLKENACEGESFVLDKDDASVTRSLPYWLTLIEQAGLRVLKQEMQTNFPDELFPVPMLALVMD